MASTAEGNGKPIAIKPSRREGIAGFIAGFTSTTLTYPLDLIKTRFQSTCYNHYKSAFDAFASIINHNGIRGLFVGIDVCVTASSLSWGSYFYFYAHSKSKLRELSNTEKLSHSQHVLAAIAAGTVTELCVSPIWVIKTNLQLNYTDADGLNAVRNTVRTIYRQRGIAGFWKGVIPSMFGVYQSSIHFMIYEHVTDLIEQRHARSMNSMEVVLNTMLSATTSSLIMYPYQIIRTRLQHCTQNEPQSIWSITRQIWKMDGLRGFYAGVWINITRILPSTCITFLVYETLKTKL
mmetsp:Transcript_44121/g.70720  ORF Transcript_44121/g.70720 Transcript_44121/m.70720 type:complete len:292 (-) Transcript_44121:121-996(-)|eukprot:CAMPEP_0197079070 /NCGR_PEP_ID=MMETSP1384-20130603/213440_1 /TAXON_ID=29189 /ORGANISM="Ammonia sp." /LENGTH=291 /DNA_ID=CAMNT_0042517943 /DNA_START=34 /DNA_END=909 /DNA_ORIENTATION=+